jgi:hypothetical protein
MEVKLWKSVGLPLSAWRLVDIARSHPVFLELYGSHGTESEALHWLVRQGMIRLQTAPELTTKEVDA